MLTTQCRAASCTSDPSKLTKYINETHWGDRVSVNVARVKGDFENRGYNPEDESNAFNVIIFSKSGYGLLSYHIGDIHVADTL
jgi:hypothetical protein